MCFYLCLCILIVCLRVCILIVMYSLPFLFYFVVLYSVSLCSFVYCFRVTVHYAIDTGFQLNCSYKIHLYLYTVAAGLLATGQYPEGRATSHLDTGFSWFPCVCL